MATNVPDNVEGGAASVPSGKTGRDFGEPFPARSSSLPRGQLSDVVPVGVCVVDRDLRYVHVNGWLARLNGATPDQHLGRTIQEMVPHVAPQIEKDCRSVLATGESILGVEFHDGEASQNARHFVVSYHPLKDSRRRVQGVISVVEDISQWRRAEFRLRESEQRYTLATSAGGVGVWDWNLRTNEIYVDPRLKALLGFQDDEIRNHIDDWGLHVHPEDRERVLNEANRHLDGRAACYEIEHRMVHKDGSIRWFLARGAAFRDETGRPYRMVGTDTDITERRRIDEALRESKRALEATEELNRAILASIPSLIAVLNEEGRIIAVNDAWTRQSPDAALDVGVDYLDACRKASRAGSRDAMEVLDGIQAVLHGASEQFVMDYECPTPSGSLWFLMTVSPLRRGGGGAVVLHADLTRQKRTEQALAERVAFERLLSDLSAAFSNLHADAVNTAIETWLEQLVEFLDVDRGTLFELSEDRERSVLIACCTREGAVPSPSSLTPDVWPWYFETLRLGEPIALSRLPDDLPEGAARERAHCLAGGLQSHLTIPLKVGGSILGHLGFTAFRHPRAWSPEIVQRLRTVGEVFANALQRKAEKQQAERHRIELTYVARVATMGEFAAAIAHELNQPLTAILSNAQAVLRQKARGRLSATELDDVLQDIAEDATRAGDMIHRLRDLLRRGEVRRSPLDVNETIRDVESFARADAIHHNVGLRLELAADLPAAIGDRLQLQQVLLNLVRNAAESMEHSNAGPREVVVRTVLDEPDTIRVSVSDHGPPVDDPTFNRMFEPFFTTKNSGMGMGLSVSRSIVQAHGGRLWAIREEGGGITIQFTLPSNPVTMGPA